MAFDVARIRGQFPALGDGWIHLDGTAGMLTPEQVASAVSSAIRTPLAAPGGTFPAARRAEHIAGTARKAVADLTGADPAGVVLGPNSVVLLRRLAAVLSQQWRSGDEVVVSRLDEHANTACWQRVARQAGAVVRWGEIDIETCDLPAWQYEDLVTERGLDHELWQVLAGTDPGGLDAGAARVREHVLRDFRRAGVDRSEEDRDRLRALAQRCTELGLEFAHCADTVCDSRLHLAFGYGITNTNVHENNYHPSFLKKQ